MIIALVMAVFMAAIIGAEGWTGQGFPMLLAWAIAAYMARGIVLEIRDARKEAGK
jgi:hypothetical protein